VIRPEGEHSLVLNGPIAAFSQGPAKERVDQISFRSCRLWIDAVVTPRVLYLFDLGFFERDLFARAQDAGAHVLMRLKKTAKIRVMGHVVQRSIGQFPTGR
jgi:hypothetical protein